MTYGENDGENERERWGNGVCEWKIGPFLKEDLKPFKVLSYKHLHVNGRKGGNSEHGNRMESRVPFPFLCVSACEGADCR